MVVLDETLANVVNLTSGLQNDGSILVNTTREVIPSLEEQNITTYTVDATQIALDNIGRNIVNTIMLGYLSAKTGVVSIDSLLTTIKSTFKGKVAETNLKATEYIYEQNVE